MTIKIIGVGGDRQEEADRTILREERKTRVLHLTLKKKWFDLVRSGKKTTEFREAKPYWDSRLMFKNGTFRIYDEVHITNGYGRNRPFLRVEFKDCILLAGDDNRYCNHGEFFTEEKYAILLGNVLEFRAKRENYDHKN
jgi:hypothetical protein